MEVVRVRGRLTDRATRQKQDCATHQRNQTAKKIPRAAADDGSEDQDEDEAQHQIGVTSPVRTFTR